MENIHCFRHFFDENKICIHAIMWREPDVLGSLKVADVSQSD